MGIENSEEVLAGTYARCSLHSSTRRRPKRIFPRNEISDMQVLVLQWEEERKRDWTTGYFTRRTSQLVSTTAFRQQTRKPVMCLNNLPTYLAPFISRSMEFIRSNCARPLARLGPPDRIGGQPVPRPVNFLSLSLSRSLFLQILFVAKNDVYLRVLGSNSARCGLNSAHRLRNLSLDTVERLSFECHVYTYWRRR